MTLRVATFNAENFYLLLDRAYAREELEGLAEDEYQAMNYSIFNRNKERGKIAAIAARILERDYDVIGIVEVGGMETLANFARIYLGGRYEPYVHEMNSKRGIFAGALVKREAFGRVVARALPGEFARNLLRLRLERGGVSLEAFVVHLKSQHGPDLGLEQRVREVAALARAVPRSRCVVMGDFNGIAIRGAAQFEFEPFLALPFRDALEAVGVPIGSRRTHYYFGRRANFAQLDYVFCSDDVEVLGARVVEDEIPINWEQRDTLPSDHLFLEAEIRVPDRAARGGAP